jgi:Ca-activated chloride channel family protein
VVLAVTPAGAKVERLELYLDGVQVGSLDHPRPPYRLAIDTGGENLEHLLEAVVRIGGKSVSTQLHTPAIHTDYEVTVGLQQVYVTVEGADGATAADLSSADFTIRDDGDTQPLVTFERGDVPFTAALLLDASASMRGEGLTTALAGVRDFAGELQRLDEAKLLLFNDRVRQETAFTAVPSLLTLTLSGLTAGGGTALNDALYLAVGRLAERQGRRVAIILSDGIDVESVLSVSDVERALVRSGVVVYWVRLGVEDDRDLDADLSRTSTWRDVTGHREELHGLAELVTASGGRRLKAATPAAVGPALREILRELRSQYVLGFYPSKTRGAGVWHRLSVSVGRRDLRLRTRAGYAEP